MFRIGSGSWNDQINPLSTPFGSSNPFAGLDRQHMGPSHGFGVSGGHGQPSHMRNRQPIVDSRDLQASQDVFRRLMPNANLHFTNSSTAGGHPEGPSMGQNELFGKSGFAQGKQQSPSNHHRTIKPHQEPSPENNKNNMRGKHINNSVLLAKQKGKQH